MNANTKDGNGKMFTTEKKISKLYLLGLIPVLLLFLLCGRRVYTHMTLTFANDLTGEAYATVWDGDRLLDECEEEEKRADLYFWGTDFTVLSPIHYDSYEEIYLKSITVSLHGYHFRTLTPEMILENFRPNQDIKRLQVEEQGLNVMTGGLFPALIPTENFLKELANAQAWISLCNLLVFVLLYTAVYWYLFRYIDLLHHHSYGDVLDAALGLIGIAALLLSWNIAFTSAYGGTIHPDEMQTRAAVDYYRTHLIQPDVRSDFVAETVSGYGMTRLSEINLYYVLAGHYANLCSFKMSFRAFGMLLFLILLCFVLKYMRKERYLAVLFFATPQLWYLFSYATSDAYDYLMTAFVVYEVLAEESSLNRIFREPFSKRRIFGYLWNGFLFANVLMAKKTFYLVLLTVFLLLLYKLIFAEKEQKRKLIANYAALLGIAFGIVLLRSLPDFYYYGIHKGEAVRQVIEATAWPEYKPSTPAAAQAASTLLYEKGVSLKGFFTEWNFNGTLLKNYFGCYSIYSLEAKTWYYVLMGVLYTALFAAVGVLFHRKCTQEAAAGKEAAVRKMRWKYRTMWGMIALMYLMTIYNAYFVDFQPQGRYLFPALPALACQISLSREISENKIVRTLIVMIAALSLYSFYKIAYLNF